MLLLCWSCSSQKEPEKTLEQVTIVSRHGVRAPLESYMSTLGTMISPAFHWAEWPVEGGHLSLRGSVLEYMAGESFREEFRQAGFSLTPADAYFASSYKQRTLETSRAFLAGLMPGADVPIDHVQVSDEEAATTDKELDSRFLPIFNWRGVADFNFGLFREEALREIDQIKDSLQVDFAYLEEVLHLEDSPYARTHGAHFGREINVLVDSSKWNESKKRVERQEPVMDCDLRYANMASDALVLMYYEQDDALLARNPMTSALSEADWTRLSSVKDAYGILLFTAPIVAVNVSYDMLLMLQQEMGVPGRKLNYFCAHDSTIQSLLAALRVKPYSLDGTIEKQTPIGIKLVIEKWKVGKEYYAKVSLRYHPTAQVRFCNPADLQTPLASFPVHFEGMEPSGPDGMYRYEDLMERIRQTIGLYAKTARGEHPFL